MTNYDLHTIYLNEFLRAANLVPAFEKVGKTIDNLVGIITEPDYMDHSLQKNSMCDYLFLFDNNYCVPGELKGSAKGRTKARSQLRQGKEFAQTYMAQRVDSGLLIVYNQGAYDVTKYEL